MEEAKKLNILIQESRELLKENGEITRTRSEQIEHMVSSCISSNYHDMGWTGQEGWWCHKEHRSAID